MDFKVGDYVRLKKKHYKGPVCFPDDLKDKNFIIKSIETIFSNTY